jgi:hypothetical protein
MSTDRRIRASRANGALSHGPKTQAGKQRCRLNAVKTGAFAKSIVLKNESPSLLAKLRDEYYQHLQPANPIERDLVEEMVVSKWLCRRAWRLESSSVNYKMDEQKDEAKAKHSRSKSTPAPPSPTRICTITARPYRKFSATRSGICAPSIAR